MNLENVEYKIWESVDNSMWNSVWGSVRVSVWDSVVVSVAYFVGDSVNDELQIPIREERAGK
jgi:hypothetical protein